MKDDLFIVPSPKDEGFVELANTPKGKLFRKQIFKMNSEFVHPNVPGAKIKIDQAFAAQMKKNFDESGNIVQVPLVNDSNHHVEDPTRNLGEVLDLDYDDTGIYATIDARKNADDFGKTFLGASAFFHPNYTDTSSGKKIGNTLLHVAVTNRPYLTNLDDYQEVVKLSADSNDEPILLTDAKSVDTINDTGNSEEEAPVTLSESEKKMTKDELIAALKDEHGVDVLALEADAAKLPAALSAADEATVALSNGEKIEVAKLAEAFVELSNKFDGQQTEIGTLKSTNDALKLSAAEGEIDGLIKVGRVLPKQRDAMIKLSMNDRETFDEILPADAVVALSESGVTVHEEAVKTASEKAVSYAERARALTTNKSKSRA